MDSLFVVQQDPKLIATVTSLLKMNNRPYRFKNAMLPQNLIVLLYFTERFKQPD